MDPESDYPGDNSEIITIATHERVAAVDGYHVAGFASAFVQFP
jgi:hypothetical protein